MVAHVLEVWVALLGAFALGTGIGIAIHRVLGRTRFYRGQYRLAAAIAGRVARPRRRVGGRSRLVDGGGWAGAGTVAGLSQVGAPRVADEVWEEPSAEVPWDEEDARWLAERPADEVADFEDHSDYADEQADADARASDETDDPDDEDTPTADDAGDPADALEPRGDEDAEGDDGADDVTAGLESTVATESPTAPVVPRSADAPLRPARSRREQEAARHEKAAEAGTRPVALRGLAVGVPDDLKAIRGIGKSNETRLHDIGIFRLAQIAKWTDAEQRWISAYIGFPGRVEREKWSGQAEALLKSRAGPRTMRDVFRERIRAAYRRD